MSKPREPKPAKLVIGLFMKEKALFEPIVDELVSQFGAIDLISRWMPFDYTAYYEQEMGTPLFRRLLAFSSLIKQLDLAGIKLETNRLEGHYTENGRRRVNIDPGYLLHERFVLASGKNFSHRIYVGKKIYADLTLIYQRGVYKKLPWTYPDYGDRPIISFLEQARARYGVDLNWDS
jgi:hypothetical protein